MPRIHEMVDSKFLKKEDAGDGILVMIEGVERQEVGTDDKPEQKWCLVLHNQKPMVLNTTNMTLLEKALGSDDSDAWVGKKVVLYNDENVSYAGKLTGGVRVDVKRTKDYHAKLEKAPASAKVDKAPKPAPIVDEAEDDIDF
jgi:hypothetical protein